MIETSWTILNQWNHQANLGWFGPTFCPVPQMFRLLHEGISQWGHWKHVARHLLEAILAVNKNGTWFDILVGVYMKMGVALVIINLGLGFFLKFSSSQRAWGTPMSSWKPPCVEILDLVEFSRCLHLFLRRCLPGVRIAKLHAPAEADARHLQDEVEGQGYRAADHHKEGKHQGVTSTLGPPFFLGGACCERQKNASCFRNPK